MNACFSQASDVVNFPATGITFPTLNNSISVYPNPNNGSFTIVLNKKFGLAGRIVFEENKTANDLSIQTYNLANGSYVVKVIANNGVYQARIAVTP